MIAEILKLQKSLNDSTNGTNWLDGFTKTGQEIDWCRCMRMELNEAIDQSVFWKHWKNITGVTQYDIFDLNNLKMEMVDTGHFLNSEIIRRNLISEIIRSNIEEVNFNKIEQGKPLVLAIEKLIQTIFKYKEEDETSILLQINDLFWEITLSIMSLKEFYELYIAKNCLNVFRQNNGYKDGTYIKEWGKDKVEDNVFVTNYFKKNNEKVVTFEELYEYLDKTYKFLNKIK